MASLPSRPDSEDQRPLVHPQPTPSASREVDRALRKLRSKIHEQGFTQLRVQEALGWGRTYISQLLRRQKSLRYDQILQILEVIEVEPAAFFAELYDLATSSRVVPQPPTLAETLLLAAGQPDELYRQRPRLVPPDGDQVVRSAVVALVRLLLKKEVLHPNEMERALRDLGPFVELGP